MDDLDFLKEQELMQTPEGIMYVLYRKNARFRKSIAKDFVRKSARWSGLVTVGLLITGIGQDVTDWTILAFAFVAAVATLFSILALSKINQLDLAWLHSQEYALALAVAESSSENDGGQ